MFKEGWCDDLGKSISSAVVLFLLAWLVIANLVFHFRHPWATETEILLNMKSAMMFETLDYEEMRPRESRD